MTLTVATADYPQAQPQSYQETFHCSSAKPTPDTATTAP